MNLPILLAMLICVATIADAKPPAEKPQPTKPARISYEGGDGSSFEKAVIIKGATEETGVHEEYEWVAKHYPDYKRRKQSLSSQNGKRYDVLGITTKDGKDLDVYFDISDFFGKF